ncbi:hypothetical protein HDC30_002398 [Pseudomonas sp. JAI115]|uniref:secretion protein n=1 Tax=Pseudomonas sp. JAI115 TaxID=2723061 RepID=UPI00161F2026|nr:secretion protein [Pseudomonas sp. JAI115]MBB6155175.1 hypothetical protein [Pseudomonas sp. JAI115]
MSAYALADPVTTYLLPQGFVPEVAYFEGSGFVVGWQVGFDDFTWVYRLDGDTLTVCDFTAQTDSQDGASGRAVSRFVALIRQIGREVEGVLQVRGRFIESMADAALNQSRERLAKILLSQGATWQEMEGEPWLVYVFAKPAA